MWILKKYKLEDNKEQQPKEFQIEPIQKPGLRISLEKFPYIKKFSEIKSSEVKTYKPAIININTSAILPIVIYI